jgi:hypothetical protein
VKCRAELDGQTMTEKYVSYVKVNGATHTHIRQDRNERTKSKRGSVQSNHDVIESDAHESNGPNLQQKHVQETKDREKGREWLSEYCDGTNGRICGRPTQGQVRGLFMYCTYNVCLIQ